MKFVITLKPGRFLLTLKIFCSPNAVYFVLDISTRGPLVLTAHLSAEDMLKSAVIEKKKFKNIESE